jgi:hypothetical protein
MVKKKPYKYLVCFINKDKIFPKAESWRYIEFLNEVFLKPPESSSQLGQIDFNIK